MQTPPAIKWIRIVLAVIPALLLLLLVGIGFGTGEKLHGKLMQWGQEDWELYRELRKNPEKPIYAAGADCTQFLPEDIRGKIESTLPKPKEEASEPASEGGDDDEEEFDLDALTDTEEVEGSEEACNNANAIFISDAKRYEEIQKQLAKPEVASYIERELSIQKLVVWVREQLPGIFVLLIMVCGFSTTLTRSHIALRPVRSKIEDRFASGGMLLANGLVAVSFWMKWSEDQTAAAGKVHDSLYYLWIGGFAAMALVNIAHLIKPVGDREGEKPPSASRAGLAVPLYASMAIISGLFFFAQGNPSKIASLIGRLLENSKLYFQVGLYIWAGMLLKQMRLSRYLLNIVKPWKLPPELLAFVVVVVAAIPTAYSGASGIFVIAAGALIYQELREAGARKQLALAATAMSGSLGVVLSPCLLVVIISYIDSTNVGSADNLFSWGVWVYVLTAVLLLIVSVVTMDGKLRFGAAADEISTNFRDGASKSLKPLTVLALVVGIGVTFGGLMLSSLALELVGGAVVFFALMIGSGAFVSGKAEFSTKVLHATLGSVKNVRSVLPYVAIGAVVLVLFSVILDMSFDPNEAANILPVVLVALLVYDRILARLKPDPQLDGVPTAVGADSAVKPRGLGSALLFATDEATEHVGALLMLMALSISLGGVVEHSGVMEAFPTSFSSPWTAMVLMVGMLVVIGMTMDPYGAAIIVNATLKQVAIDSGIDAVHFWLVVLTAFELGYLTPPVALNHLLTRQVVGDDADDDELPEDASFWQRHEKIMLPLVVAATALVIVAFVPFLFY